MTEQDQTVAFNRPDTDIENQVERFEEMIKQSARIEAIKERRRLYQIIIKLNVGIISILCALSAIFNSI